MNADVGIPLKKSNSTEFFRIIFIVVLCIHHLNISNVIQHGYIAVEFFGILSGFLLAKSANSSELSAYEYTMRRFKRFAPIYIWALVVQVTLISVQAVINGEFKFLDTFFKAIPEIFMVADSGIYSGAFNYPMWYLSPLMIGGGILWYLYKNHKEITCNVIAPIVILITYTSIFGNSDQIEWFKTIYGFSLMFWRVIADLCIGILTFQISSKISDKDTKVINVLFFISCIGSSAIIISHEYYDKYALILFAVIILGCFCENCFINTIFKNCGAISEIGKYSFSIYCNHAVLGGLFHTFVTSKLNSHTAVLICEAVYLALVIVYAVIAYKITGKIVKHFANRR